MNNITGIRNRTIFNRAFNRDGGGGKKWWHHSDLDKTFLLAAYRDLTRNDLVITSQRQELDDLFQSVLGEELSIPQTFKRLFSGSQFSEYHRALVFMFAKYINVLPVSELGVIFEAGINRVVSQPFIPGSWPVRSKERRFFVPAVFTDKDAAADLALPIGYGQTIDQPSLVKLILEKAEIKPGDMVLEIGSGSGWVLAQLSHLVGERGRVFGAERVPKLRERGRSVLNSLGYTNIEFFEIDEKGFPLGLTEQMADAIDTIIISAEVPWDGTGYPFLERLAKYVKESGRIIFPANGAMKIIVGGGESRILMKNLFTGVAFVPLIIEKKLQLMLDEILLPHDYASQLQALLGLVETGEGVDLLIDKMRETGQQELQNMVIGTLQTTIDYYNGTEQKAAAFELQQVLNRVRIIK